MTTTKRELANQIYADAIAAGKPKDEAVFAAADVYDNPESYGFDPAPGGSGSASSRPEPAPPVAEAPGDPLLEAQERHAAEAEARRNRAQGARVLLAEGSGMSLDELAEVSDDEALEWWEQHEKREADRAEANDPAAVAAAIAKEPAWPKLSWDDERREAWKRDHPGEPVVGTPWNVAEAGEA